MKHAASFIVALALVCIGVECAPAQSGRRKAETPKATYPVPLPSPAKPAPKERSVIDPEAKVYQCIDDKPLLDKAAALKDEEENVVPGKELSSKPKILAKPHPDYPSAARRNGTSGTVVLKVLLSSSAKVTTVKVVRDLPDGLTESAVKAACRIRFNPGMKDGRPVSYYVLVEYGFMVSSRPRIGTRWPPWP